MRKSVFILLFLGVAGLTAGGAGAGDDHEEAYRLRKEEGLLPLATLLERAGITGGERILEIESSFDGGRNLYEIEYVTPQGRIMEVTVDARTGAVLTREEED